MLILKTKNQKGYRKKSTLLVTLDRDLKLVSYLGISQYRILIHNVMLKLFNRITFDKNIIVNVTC